MTNNIMGIPIVDVGSLKKELETYKEALSLACDEIAAITCENCEDLEGEFLKKARQG